MPDEIESNAIDVLVFDAIDGSQTSADSQGFALHAWRRNGTGVMLVFPHSEISKIVENAAMQLSRGRDESGRPLKTAFHASSFQLNQGSRGETVLTPPVGEAGNINFLMPTNKPEQLSGALRKLYVRQ
jgi:hypothetical protein